MRKYHNVTLAIDEQIHHNLRVWCALRNVSISRVFQDIARDLPRLEKVRRYPLPEAPEYGSIGELFDGMQTAEIEQLMRSYGQ